MPQNSIFIENSIIISKDTYLILYYLQYIFIFCTCQIIMSSCRTIMTQSQEFRGAVQQMLLVSQAAAIHFFASYKIM
jgi:hypothetical protein